MPLVTTDSTGVLIFPQNKLRKSFTIQNTDATISIYIGRQNIGTLSSTNFDRVLDPGASLDLNALLDGVESIQDRWNARAVSGNPVIAWFETETFQRDTGTFNPQSAIEGQG